ncbi:hypothetical protein AB0Y20_01015 [Heyndrickxia oleronia]|uniref:phage lytic cycle repressor MrpR family protein n=1 Tax=Heyndrickxia oleronia TaxID=38875 RepID=UPI003F231E24
MNKLYNEEIKNRFLEEVFPFEDSRLTATYVFYHSYLIEEPLGKDLFDFNLEEIGKVIVNSNPKSLNVSASRGSIISQYINWAASSSVNLRKSNINPLQGIDRVWYQQFVDENIVQFISKSELDYMVKRITNYQDKIIPVLLFNGVYGTQSSEIRNIQRKHLEEIKNNKLTVYDDVKGAREIELEDYVIQMMWKALEEERYDLNNGLGTDRFTDFPLIESDYVIKPVKKGRALAGQRASQMLVIQRFEDIKEWFEYPDISPKSINRSGMLYIASQLIGNKEELNKEDFEIIGDRFNLSKTNNGGYFNYNTHYLKGYINKENINKLYPKED